MKKILFAILSFLILGTAAFSASIISFKPFRNYYFIAGIKKPKNTYDVVFSYLNDFSHASLKADSAAEVDALSPDKFDAASGAFFAPLHRNRASKNVDVPKDIRQRIEKRILAKYPGASNIKISYDGRRGEVTLVEVIPEELHHHEQTPYYMGLTSMVNLSFIQDKTSGKIRLFQQDPNPFMPIFMYGIIADKNIQPLTAFNFKLPKDKEGVPFLGYSPFLSNSKVNQLPIVQDLKTQVENAFADFLKLQPEDNLAYEKLALQRMGAQNTLPASLKNKPLDLIFKIGISARSATNKGKREQIESFYFSFQNPVLKEQEFQKRVIEDLNIEIMVGITSGNEMQILARKIGDTEYKSLVGRLRTNFIDSGSGSTLSSNAITVEFFQADESVQRNITLFGDNRYLEIDIAPEYRFQIDYLKSFYGIEECDAKLFQ